MPQVSVSPATVATLLSTVGLAATMLTQSERLAASRSWRAFMLSTALVNGLFLVAITEVLSAFGALRTAWVVIAWIVAAAVQAPAMRVAVRTIGQGRPRAAPFAWGDTALLAALVVAITCTLVVALASAPNNWDSMTYHMARVAHWRQNETVAFYPTSINRQLFPPPFAEFAIAHLQIIAGGDRFANMVQWTCFVGNALGVSLIAGQFGAKRRGQLLAAVFAVTLPMAILQGSSTQNDLVVSFWLVCFCYFAIRFARDQEWGVACAAAAACGLALMTKSTAYLFLPELATAVFVANFPAYTAVSARKIIVVLVPALGIQGAHYARNFEVYGSPLGSVTTRVENANDKFGVRPLAANLIRGAASHVNAPPGRLRLQERFLALSDRVQRRSPSPDDIDPTILRPPAPYRIVDWRDQLRHEDMAGAPFHMLVVLPVLLVAVFRKRRDDEAMSARYYALALCIGVIFVAGYLKWSPGKARFHLTGLILFAPLAGAWLATLRVQALALCASALLFVQSWYPLVTNTRRPLLGARSIFRTPRAEQYFVEDHGPQYNTALMGASGFLSARTDAQIGLLVGLDSYEYPYWALIPRVKSRETRMCHVGVSDASRVLTSAEACSPPVIVSDTATAASFVIDGRTYASAWSRPPIGVYVRQ